MLAPMQGLTHSALRSSYLEHYHPDTVFTEFVHIQNRSRKRVTKADLEDITTHHSDTPLVVQLIGSSGEALADAAQQLQDLGCHHFNLNLGCPYGRMTTGATGGELLREPAHLVPLLRTLRKAISGSFSVKCRAGYSDTQQLYELLSLYYDSGIDYLIIHPRTVVQRYSGSADHTLTAETVRRTPLPVIANGDINDAATGQRLLHETGASGLMLGRGALADPWLFQRIRGELPSKINEAQRRRDLFNLLTDLLPRYLTKFSGERQTLMKLKDHLNFIPDPCLRRDIGKLKRTTTVTRFLELLENRFSS